MVERKGSTVIEIVTGPQSLIAEILVRESGQEICKMADQGSLRF